jgi:hypothetical protein
MGISNGPKAQSTSHLRDGTTVQGDGTRPARKSGGVPWFFLPPFDLQAQRATTFDALVEGLSQEDAQATLLELLRRQALQLEALVRVHGVYALGPLNAPIRELGTPAARGAAHRGR